MIWERLVALNGGKEVLVERLRGFKLYSDLDEHGEGPFWKAGYWKEFRNLSTPLYKKIQRAIDIQEEFLKLIPEIFELQSELAREIKEIDKAITNRRGEGNPYPVKRKSKGSYPKKEKPVKRVDLDWITGFLNPGLLNKMRRKANIHPMEDSNKKKQQGRDSVRGKKPSLQGGDQTTYVLEENEFSKHDLEVIADQENSDSARKFKTPNKNDNNKKNNRKNSNNQQNNQRSGNNGNNHRQKSGDD